MSADPTTGCPPPVGGPSARPGSPQGIRPGVIIAVVAILAIAFFLTRAPKKETPVT